MFKSLFALALGAVLAWPHAILSASFTNSAPIAFATSTPEGYPGPSTPYPSIINVASLSGTVSNITLTLFNLTHDRPDDMQMLLVGPNGAKFVILADVGGTTVGLLNATITLSDSAPLSLSDLGPLASGTYRPTCIDFQNTIHTDFLPPAPLGPYAAASPRGIATFTSAFAGSNPNGVWSLYVVDDIANPSQVASIGSGWALDITTTTQQVSSTTLASSLNPSFTSAPNNLILLKATVQATNGTPVTNGTVVFRDGGVILGSPLALDALGTASFNPGPLGEGSHLFTATYSGSAAFAPSAGSIVQSVKVHSTILGSQFSNTNLFTISDSIPPLPSTPYPSTIDVTGLTGALSKVSMVLSNVSHPNPDDLRFLLVGPNGASLVVMANVGGANSISNITIRLDDAATSLLPDSGPIANNSYRPTAIASSVISFPLPAPGPPYSLPAPAGPATFASSFSGGPANGTWSLYPLDDVPGNGGGSVGGWSLIFVMTGEQSTVTTLISSANPSLVGAPLLLTASVQDTGGVSVTSGTITFRQGTNVLATSPLDSGGRASLNLGFPEGTYPCSADYNGAASQFLPSTVTITQIIDRVTQVTNHTFTNPSRITFSQSLPGTSDVYPSRLNVSGIPLPITKLTVNLASLNHPNPQDLSFLLVAPDGTAMVILSDANAVGDISLDDSAAALAPYSVGPASGLMRPTSYAYWSSSRFPLPAPTDPYLVPAPRGSATLAAFNGHNPNGVWSLYALDTSPSPGQVASLAGWSLSMIGPQTAVSAIKAASPSPTNASSVSWSVYFTNLISGLTVSNFNLTASGISSASIVSVVPTTPGSSSNWTVTANTGFGDGTLRLDLMDTLNVSHTAVNAPFLGEVYIIDKTPPIFSVALASPPVTTNGPISFTVTYNPGDTVTLAAADVVINTTYSAQAANISVSGTGPTRTVTLSNITGSGTLGISLRGGTARDTAGNFSGPSLPSATVRTSTYFSVTNPNDSGPGSLRQAILDVDSPGLIDFNGLNNFINLTAVGDSVYGPSALRIDKAITLIGSVSNGLVIGRSNATNMRLFIIAPTGSLTLKNITLRDGFALGLAGGSGAQRGGGGGGSGGLGGAIFNQGDLIIENSTLTSNQAIGGAGAGRLGGGGQGSGGGGAGLNGPGGAGGASSVGGAGGGPLGGSGGSFTGSGRAGGEGGGGGGGGSGIFPNGAGAAGMGGFGGGGAGGGAYDTRGFGGGNGGAAGIGGFAGGGGGSGGGTPDGIAGLGGFAGGNGMPGDGTGNVGGAGGGGGGAGGAIFNHAGRIFLTNVTLSGNAAVGGPGGTNFGTLPTGGQGSGVGGAIFNRNGTVTLVNCTIADNIADRGGAAVYNLGDGAARSSVIAINTIMARSRNGASDFASSRLNGASLSNAGNNNLIQRNAGFAGGIVSSADPFLSPLANNGGPTPTHQLGSKSPAIDRGDNSAAPITDQRGYPRIADGDGDGTATVDIGALELGLVRLRFEHQTPADLQMNGIRFFLTGEGNRIYSIEYSTDLIRWNLLQSYPFSGIELPITDPAGVAGVRFYRAHLVP